jgi:4-alpha-glucanotransferase
MYVLQYEQRPQGSITIPEREVVASVNTHDMPSFAAHWKGEDIADRVDLGLIPTSQVAAEKKGRQLLRKNLIATLRRKNLLRAARPSTEQVLDGMLRFLAKSPAETVLVTLEDLWNEERSQNVPGTSAERPNWRRKAARTIEELRADETLAARLREVLAR